MAINFLLNYKVTFSDYSESQSIMKDLSDLEIIESVRNGNHSDYSILIDRYKNRAFSLLNRMLKNEMDAEEVLQDSFLKAFNCINITTYFRF